MNVLSILYNQSIISLQKYWTTEKKFSFLLLMNLHTLINREFLPCKAYQYHFFFFFCYPRHGQIKWLVKRSETEINFYWWSLCFIPACTLFFVYMHQGFIAFVTCCINYNMLCECILLFVYTHERSPDPSFLFLVSGLAAMRWSYSLLYGNMPGLKTWAHYP